MTTITNPAATAFWSAATDEAAGGCISFDRCVDWLLDLHQSTTDHRLRALVTDVLHDLRELGPVDRQFEDLVLGALASVEMAFEIAANR
jgi:hypothetical protein